MGWQDDYDPNIDYSEGEPDEPVYDEKFDPWHTGDPFHFEVDLGYYSCDQCGGGGESVNVKYQNGSFKFQSMVGCSGGNYFENEDKDEFVRLLERELSPFKRSVEKYRWRDLRDMVNLLGEFEVPATA